MFCQQRPECPKVPGDLVGPGGATRSLHVRLQTLSLVIFLESLPYLHLDEERKWSLEPARAATLSEGAQLPGRMAADHLWLPW